GWTRMTMPEKQLREGIPLFGGTPEECQNRIVNCPELAVRDDLPHLCANDQVIIAEKIERVFASNELHIGYSGTHADLELEYDLPWFAKYKPQRLAELGARFRLAALDLPEVGPALGFGNQLPYSGETVPP